MTHVSNYFMQPIDLELLGQSKIIKYLVYKKIH